MAFVALGGMTANTLEWLALVGGLVAGHVFFRTKGPPDEDYRGGDWP